METFKVKVDPLFCTNADEYLEFNKFCCANCCKPLGSRRKLVYLVSTLGDIITLSDAISVVFEMAKKLNPTVILDETDAQYITMCADCHSVFTDLFNSYSNFLKMTKSKSYIRTCVGDSTLWEEKEKIGNLPSLSKENENTILVQFEPVKVDTEKVLFNPACQMSDLPATLDDMEQLEHNDVEQKVVTTSHYVEKFPVVKVNKLSIWEINSATNWASFLEKRLEWTTSVDKSRVKMAKCSSCGRQFLEARGLKIHHDAVHKNISRPFACQLCDQKFTYGWFHKHHIDTFHSGIEIQFMCKLCDKKFKTLKELNHHKKVIHNETLDPFRCNYCEKGYDDIDDLRGHLIERHANSKAAKAALDNRKYTSITSTEGGESLKTHSCSICKLEFSHPLTRDKHVRYFHEKRTACVFCDQVFFKPAECRVHEKSHDSFQCLKCDDVFNTLTKVYYHMKRAHNDFTGVCEICGKSYQSTYNLNCHYKWHKITSEPAQFMCNVCNKLFSLKHSFLNHMKYFHTKLKRKFNCSLCAKSYSAKSLLQTHKENFHGLKGSYKCPSCIRTFSCTRSLLHHSRTHRIRAFKPKPLKTGDGEFDIMACYSEEKLSFICSICGATIKRKDHFVRHVKSQHTSIKRVPASKINCHKCGTCETTFDSRSEYLTHLETKGHRGWLPQTHISLNDAGEEAYECDICGKYILRKDKFLRHQRIHKSNKFKRANGNSSIGNQTVKVDMSDSDEWTND